ncbi:MAG TPA: beta-ketoacyl-[acyl-carrier-protein] synthase family protein [Burkholderiaceae bacterium]|nr:beta-ketoacyl-[acyl-carrier-protein] synthase family protein [Burkholderiaceae bacterium]
MLRVTHHTLTSCIGLGRADTVAALRARRSGLKPCAFETVALETWIGEVAGLDDRPVRRDLASYDCRNNRLAELAFEQDGFAQSVARAVQRHGARRIGVFVGTSTSGILQTELAYRRRDPHTGALPSDFEYAHVHNTYSIADFTRAWFGLEGPAFAVSAACASSAKVYADAQRMLDAGLIDAAVVGGVDSLCLTTLYGFESLELLSRRPCRPFDAARDGISIGEAAAFALLERVEAKPSADDLLLLGCGESSDGYHMSSPHPEGLGAKRAILAALADAGLEPDAIDYVNLHGTGTPSNDAAEDAAVVSVLGTRVPCSSTKGATGHALGAAGGLEAGISLLALEIGLVPGGLHTESRDPALACHYVTRNLEAPVRHVLTNSFGFGGANCCLIFGRGRA